MDATLLYFLLLDALQNGVIYGLLAVALVLVFAVTRVILVPIGELMMFAPLSYVWLLEGRLPGTLFLTLAFLLVWAGLERWTYRFMGRILLLAVGLFFFPISPGGQSPWPIWRAWLWFWPWGFPLTGSSLSPCGRGWCSPT